MRNELRKVLCHFWWQKWRKSHAPHLWRRREAQSLKRMLRRQSVCRLRFFTALRLSSAATAKSVAYPPTMRSAGFRCALGARVSKKDTRERRGTGATRRTRSPPFLFAGSFFDTREQKGARVTRVTGETGTTRATGEAGGPISLVLPVLPVFPVFPVFLVFPLGRPAPAVG